MRIPANGGLSAAHDAAAAAGHDLDQVVLGLAALDPLHDLAGIGQAADDADLQLGPLVGEGEFLDGVGAPEGKAQRADALELLTGADAVAAENALIGVADDGRGAVVDLPGRAGIFKPNLGDAQPVGQPLEVALAALDAGGAVPAVGRQQQLQNQLPMALDPAGNILLLPPHPCDRGAGPSWGGSQAARRAQPEWSYYIEYGGITQVISVNLPICFIFLSNSLISPGRTWAKK